jgi:hypothetical protein
MGAKAKKGTSKDKKKGKEKDEAAIAKAAEEEAAAKKKEEEEKKKAAAEEKERIKAEKNKKGRFTTTIHEVSPKKEKPDIKYPEVKTKPLDLSKRRGFSIHKRDTSPD